MTFENPDKKMPSSFGYSLYPDKEVGFYVVCSDRMILDKINSMMKNRGFVGISDTAGRLHYMVDARFGVHSAVTILLRKHAGRWITPLCPIRVFWRLSRRFCRDMRWTEVCLAQELSGLS